MLRRFTFEQFMDSLLECVRYSRELERADAEIFMEATCVQKMKLPKEVQEALETLFEKFMNEAVNDDDALGNIEVCVSNIIAGNAPEEVIELMKKYHEASRKMFEEDFEGRIIFKNKAQYELESLEGELAEQGYFIRGGFEAYSNLFDENFDPEDFD